MPSTVRTASSRVAPMAEPVMVSRTTQPAATAAATAHRFRLRGGSGARAGRRTASLRSVIEHRPWPIRRVRDGVVRQSTMRASTGAGQPITGSSQISGSYRGPDYLPRGGLPRSAPVRRRHLERRTGRMTPSVELRRHTRSPDVSAGCCRAQAWAVARTGGRGESQCSRQLTTFRAKGPHPVAALERFGRFFAGQLWEVYGPRRSNASASEPTSAWPRPTPPPAPFPAGNNARRGGEVRPHEWEQPGSLPLPGRQRHAGGNAAAELKPAARTWQGTILKYTVRTADGRRLSTQVYGDPDGRPVFLLHGTPGSRLGPHPRAAVLHRLGVQLISFDRPGYGESDRLAGRQGGAAAADVLTIADAHGLEKFSVVGRSGGGPHALACAALLPERTTKAAVLVGLAPHGAEGLDWFDGMAQSNVTEYTAAANGYEDIVAHTKAMASAVRANPASLIARLQAELPDPDRRVVADRGIRSMLIETYAEALRIG